jgi:hypothetical protein
MVLVPFYATYGAGPGVKDREDRQDYCLVDRKKKQT